MIILNVYSWYYCTVITISINNATIAASYWYNIYIYIRYLTTVRIYVSTLQVPLFISAFRSLQSHPSCYPYLAQRKLLWDALITPSVFADTMLHWAFSLNHTHHAPIYGVERISLKALLTPSAFTDTIVHWARAVVADLPSLNVAYPYWYIFS